MLRLSGPVEFDGFGPSRFAAGGRPRRGELELARCLRTSRKRVRERLPAAPGVYGMVDAEGDLIYVGKSKSLVHRVSSYFATTPRDAKARRIAERARRLVWERWGHEFTALLRELELIRRWQPRLNVQGDPRRLRRTYVCLGRGPAAHVYVASRPSGRDAERFGPVGAGRRLRETVRLVNSQFGLRDCPERVPVMFADQGALFGPPREALCIRYDLGQCLGPCEGLCTREEYAEQVRACRDFLSGRDGRVLDRLASQMLEAAAAGQFERAATLRDTREALAELDAQLGRLREVRGTYSFVYPLRNHRRGESWHLIRRGQVVAATPGPRDEASARRCLELLRTVYSDGEATESVPDDWGVVLLVSAWFRRHSAELERTLSVKEALRRCGGYFPERHRGALPAICRSFGRRADGR